MNPVAGLGGRVGLKGTDGANMARLARELGAEPVAPERTARALARLARCPRLSIVAGAGVMGADLARAHALETKSVAGRGCDETTAENTREAAAEMERRQVDLILYAGGDGTTRDIVGAVGARVPILGIPTGVKMHSGTFATSPEAAAEVAEAYATGVNTHLRDAEVMDVDEQALGAGRVSARLYGVARVPYDRLRVQHPKAAARSADADLDALCRTFATALSELTLFGPGTTTKRILDHLGVDGTLLGVDAVQGSTLAGRDLNETDLLRLLDSRPARLVVGVVGGQGYIFGRGNQQLSPEVLRRIGLDNIEIIASADKLLALDPPILRVDTGDTKLDAALAGFRRVRVAPNRSLVLAVSP